MKKTPWLEPASLAVILLSSSFAASASEQESHQHHQLIEEIVVTAAFKGKVAETSLPVTVISGEALIEKTANTLGETLKNEIGVAGASFGPGVSHPVIRGQTGNRVSVLSNGVGVTDASSQSPDHSEAVETLLAERIEVVRGPATLLYGSGAVGGVVNVVDARIPETLADTPSIAIEQSYNLNNNERKSVFRIDASQGAFGFHLDGYHRSSDNVEISGFAIDEEAIEARDELLHGDEHEHEDGDEHGDEHADEHGDEAAHDDEHEEELANTLGYINNSDTRASGGSAGFSWVGDRGFIGLSVSQIDNNYGLPPGTHSHHHHDEAEVPGMEEAEIDFVRIDMEKRRYDIRGKLNFSDGWLDSINAAVGYSDYEHNEIEFFSDGTSETGTTYSNKGTESRFVLNRRKTGNWSGTYGLQTSATTFGARGEEAFIPSSDITQVGLFGVERFEGTRFTVETGFRFDSNEVDPGACGTRSDALSLSGSIIYDVNSDSNLLLGVSRSERTPSVEELFSNISAANCQRTALDADLVPHAATALIEIGDPSLDNETANNLELGYRLNAEMVTGEISLFWNSIQDYIFLAMTGDEVDGQFLASYTARDAVFSGVEAKITLKLREQGPGIDWGLYGDLVRAKFDGGGDVPRIPPAKFGTELRFHGEHWAAKLQVTHFDDQDRVGSFELATDSYTLLEVSADYHWNLGTRGELMLFARGSNLFDDEVRNHASFIKHYAPDAGRSIRLGIRYTY